MSNALDAPGLRRILSRTKSRFKRIEQEREGALVLIAMLERELAVLFSAGSQKQRANSPEYGTARRKRASIERLVRCVSYLRPCLRQRGTSSSISFAHGMRQMSVDKTLGICFLLSL